MLNEILGAALRLVDQSPRHTGERCLLERHAVGGCDRCAQACPHEAIRLLEEGAEVLEDACSGCGLCVQACPTGALEYELDPVLGRLKDQGVRSDPNAEPVQACLECSKVPGATATVACLARVTPAAMLASAAWGQALTLIHGDCEHCPLGDLSVIRTVSAARRTAEGYRGRGEPERWVRIVEASDDGPETPRRPPPEARPVSRREAFGAMFSGLKRGAARAIPDRPLPGISAAPEPGTPPEEWRWRQAFAARTPGRAYWPAPVVNDSCTLCQVCATLCPTDALRRDALGDGRFELSLALSACTGCEACVVSCPSKAMHLEPYWTTEALSSTIVLHQGTIENSAVDEANPSPSA